MLKGQTVLQRTLQRAQQARKCSKLVVATEDQRIAEHVQSIGVTAVMTRGEWKSGTDRIYEAWRRVEEQDGLGAYQVRQRGNDDDDDER